MNARRSAAFVLVAGLLAASPARAQVSDADRATARTLAQKGQEALEAGDFPTAADRFAKADAIIHAPTLVFGLAMAQKGLGKWVKARELLEQILREGVPKGSPPAWSAALKDAEKELAALKPKIPTVAVTVAGAPSAEVTIDGAAVPAGGAARPLDPGPHTIRATAPGMKPAESKLTLAEGRAETVTLALVPADGAPAPEPAAAPEAPASPRPWQKPAGFAGIGVGGALLVVGAATGTVALSKHAALAKVCTDGRCKGQQDAIDSYNAMGNASTATFILGAAFAATGVALVVTAPKPAAGSSAWIAPVIGLGHAGVQGGF
jgi:hypothetical protein